MGYRAAILLHLAPWDEGMPETIELATGIRYALLGDSAVWELYESLCANQNLDDGEPYGYSTYFDIDHEQYGSIGGDFFSPYDIYMRLCNMVTICSDCSIGMAKIIISRDNYKSAQHVLQLFDYTFQKEQVAWASKINTSEKYLHFLKDYFSRDELLFKAFPYSNRVTNALAYFFYAWRSHHLEPACINLSVVLESLFGPENSTELSHQIAFNAAKFCGSSHVEREEIYKNIKKFYSVRSSIIHGSVPSEDKVLAALDYTFPFVVSVLRKIMTDADTFRDFKENRNNLINRWLFD